MAGRCWPSAADEEWYSPKRPSSTVAIQHCSGSSVQRWESPFFLLSWNHYTLSYIHTYHLHFQVVFWIMKQDWIVSWFSRIYVDDYSFVHFAAPQQTSLKGVLWGVPICVIALVNMSCLHKQLLISLLPAFLSRTEVCPHIEGRKKTHC